MKRKKRKYFITGFLIVLPILTTVYLFVTLFLFFDNILGRYIAYFTVAYFGYKIPGLGLLVFILIIFLTGFFATNFIGKKFLLYIENLWSRFPVVKKIYPAAKQITKFLFGQNIQGHVQKVVLVEFPRKGCYALGFVTNHSDKTISEKVGKDLLNVLIPHVPSPWSGMLILVPTEEVIFLNISIEEAIKIIVSGGVLNPKDLLDISS
jgi:uncharacterized membrane protein